MIIMEKNKCIKILAGIFLSTLLISCTRFIEEKEPQYTVMDISDLSMFEFAKEVLDEKELPAQVKYYITNYSKRGFGDEFYPRLAKKPKGKGDYIYLDYNEVIEWETQNAKYKLLNEKHIVSGTMAYASSGKHDYVLTITPKKEKIRALFKYPFLSCRNWNFYYTKERGVGSKKLNFEIQTKDQSKIISLHSWKSLSKWPIKENLKFIEERFKNCDEPYASGYDSNFKTETEEVQIKKENEDVSVKLAEMFLKDIPFPVSCKRIYRFTRNGSKIEKNLYMRKCSWIQTKTNVSIDTFYIRNNTVQTVSLYVQNLEDKNFQYDSYEFLNCEHWVFTNKNDLCLMISNANKIKDIGIAVSDMSLPVESRKSLSLDDLNELFNEAEQNFTECHKSYISCD